MTIQIMKEGACVARSRNLRGILDYARRSPVAHIETSMGYDGSPVRGLVLVKYADGAHCLTDFASYHIMIDWLRGRRSWRGATWTHRGEDMGYLTQPGIIAGTK
jgi:hypothetical protein